MRAAPTSQRGRRSPSICTGTSYLRDVWGAPAQHCRHKHCCLVWLTKAPASQKASSSP